MPRREKYEGEIFAYQAKILAVHDLRKARTARWKITGRF